MDTENKEINKPNLTEEELQGLYVYLSMHFKEFTQEQKNVWILLMKQLDPEFNDTEDES